MRGVADELNPNGFNEECNWHSFQRLGVNTREHGLQIFDDDQDTKLQKIYQFCDKAKKDLSKKDMKKKKMLSTHARGINSYLDGLELNDEDRSRICRYERPEGWISRFDDDSVELTESESKVKQSLMLSKKVFPKIKVSRCGICGYCG